MLLRTYTIIARTVVLDTFEIRLTGGMCEHLSLMHYDLIEARIQVVLSYVLPS
jgi:hypothetical protein